GERRGELRAGLARREGERPVHDDLYSVGHSVGTSSISASRVCGSPFSTIAVAATSAQPSPRDEPPPQRVLDWRPASSSPVSARTSASGVFSQRPRIVPLN